MNQTCTRLALLAVLLLGGAMGCSEDVSEDVDESSDEIVGGTEARPGAWPGAVAVYYGSQQGCGGSLVADSWVVTAAHCIDTSSPAGGVSKVVIGRHRLSTTLGETRTVDRVIRHEGFNQSMDNDLALLHLSSPSQLPKAPLVRGAQAGAVVAGANVTVVGWGDTSEGGSQSDVLRQVSIPVVANAKCAGYESYEYVTANQICAGQVRVGKKDSCQGDSGGPLFMSIRGERVQVGLVSWGIGCARPKAPGVYTRLANYLDWMRDKSGGAIGGTAN
jgi:secreted trypsin-like serine protease